ncbi:RimJ/RimL family protein N-acetyltransferase [Blastococcus colisei]|uniref:RimJ/RimL family protein N-acetyltransferase n=1 Tax=Blastococcus colisei TaxID=1564162 RepID=A0A543PBV5_9ACTN|nr:GNAT family N-acetyltransferase [Blastococcus colisei]TQN41552.1 RimJ/RimL family protein N-acetyltransferase [Blastococcus colisei]
MLRPYRVDDVDAVFRACPDPEITRWLSALPSPYTREAAVEYVTGVAPRARAGGTDLGCVVEADGDLVGSCGMHALTAGRLGPEIGYWTAHWARGKGYAAEAAGDLVEWAFAHGAARVHLFVDVANTAPLSVARRAGFEEEGIVRRCLDYRDRRTADAVLFGRQSA